MSAPESTASEFRHGVLLALKVCAVVLVVVAIFVQLRVATPDPHLRDFRTIMATGAASRLGLNPYANYPLTARMWAISEAEFSPNLNPPVSVWVFELLTPPDVEPGWSPLHPVLYVALRNWWVVYVVSYGLMVWLLWHRYRDRWDGWRLLWVLGLAAMWDTLILGTFYMPLALLITLAWLLQERWRQVSAGLIVGLLIALKPNLLVWPAVELLAGRRRFAIVSVLTAAAVTAVPLLHYEPEIYRQWWEVVQWVSSQGRTAYPVNGSLLGIAQRAGVPAVGYVTSAALLLGIAAWAWRCRPRPARAASFALLAALLASPVAWVHYGLFLVPIYLSRKRWGPLMWASAALWTVPVYLNIEWWGGPTWLRWTGGQLVSWALLLLLGSLVFEREQA